MKKLMVYALSWAMLMGCFSMTSCNKDDDDDDKTENTNNGGNNGGQNNGGQNGNENGGNNGGNNGNENGGNNGGGNENTNPVSDPIVCSVVGDIDHETPNANQSATVTFNRFPKTVAEFKEARKQLASEPAGAAALELMAYEIYRHDKSAGEQCIKLNNPSNNQTLVTNRLKELFGSDANYARPYQVAAYFEGATWNNGYAPTKPYTLQVYVDPVLAYQESSIFQCNELHLLLKAPASADGKGAFDTPRKVSVINTKKPGEPNDGFSVENCPALYQQVREISFSTPFAGLD